MKWITIQKLHSHTYWRKRTNIYLLNYCPIHAIYPKWIFIISVYGEARWHQWNESNHMVSLNFSSTLPLNCPITWYFWYFSHELSKHWCYRQASTESGSERLLYHSSFPGMWLKEYIIGVDSRSLVTIESN